MADDLGARLVQAGLVTRAQLGEVLGAAPPHEGALVAGLVDHGVSEDALAGFFVAGGFGPLMESSDLAAAEPEARRSLPASMAVHLFALPVRRSPAGLVVAMAAPTDRHALSEIRRSTGGEVLPTVARANELRAALRVAYPGAPREPAARPNASEPPVLELVKVRRPAPQPEAPGYRGSTRGAERVEARALVGPRLVPDAPDDDEGFVPLVRHKPVKRTPAYPSGRRVVTRRFEKLARAPDERVVPVGEGGPDGWAKGEGAARAKVEPAQLPPAPPAPKRSIIPPEHERWDLDGPASPPSVGRGPGAPGRERPPAEPPPRRGKPGPIGGTLSAIRASHDRDEVVSLACQGALTVARASVLLALRKGVLKGVEGAGSGLSRDAVRNLWIPTSSPSMFRRVVSRALPYRGAPGTTAADGLFRAALGNRGGEVAIQPVGVGGKVVAALAVDDLRFGDVGAERLEVLAKAVGEAFERIIVARKR